MKIAWALRRRGRRPNPDTNQDINQDINTGGEHPVDWAAGWRGGPGAPCDPASVGFGHEQANPTLDPEFGAEFGAEFGGGVGGGVDPGLVAALDRDLDEWFTGAPHSGRERAWLPEYLEVAPRHVAVGPELAASLVVVGYPREVHGGWLEPLTSYPGRLDVSLHVEPIPPQVASARLRRQLARMESSRYGDAEHGRLTDPYLDAAAADAHELAGRVARSETRLFRVALSLLVRAGDPDELAEQVDAVSCLAASMLLDARPVTYRALPGWIAAQPWALDPLGQRRTMDTDCLAAAFPFAATELPADPVHMTAPGGVLYGRNLSGPGLVWWDRWSQPNYNSITLAESGFGKSYLTKLEVIRGLYTGVHGLGIDPENEYAGLTAAVGGTYIRLGEPGVRVNPLDLPHRGDQPSAHPGDESAGPDGPPVSDVLTRRQLYLHTVLAVLLGEALTPAQRAIADRGIHACYHHAGITHDPSTWNRPAPLLADLAAALACLNDAQGVGVELARRLEPYTHGSFATLFNGPTTYPDATDTHLVVFSLRSLPEELKPAGTLLALDAIWRTVSDPHNRRRRLVFVDEGWLLLQHPAGAQFLYRLAKSARKYWAGLALVTQDAADVLNTDLGKAVVSNASTRILLRTAPQAADHIKTAIGLSDGEIAYLTSAEIGAGLLVAGHRHRVAFRAQASQAEDALATTDPAQLAASAPPHRAGPGGEPSASPPFRAGVALGDLTRSGGNTAPPDQPAVQPHPCVAFDAFEDDPL